MAQYTVQFPFPMQGQALATGDTIELDEAQAKWYLIDGRITFTVPPPPPAE